MNLHQRHTGCRRPRSLVLAGRPCPCSTQGRRALSNARASLFTKILREDRRLTGGVRLARPGSDVWGWQVSAIYSRHVSEVVQRCCAGSGGGGPSGAVRAGEELGPGLLHAREPLDDVLPSPAPDLLRSVCHPRPVGIRAVGAWPGGPGYRLAGDDRHQGLRGRVALRIQRDHHRQPGRGAVRDPDFGPDQGLRCAPHASGSGRDGGRVWAAAGGNLSLVPRGWWWLWKPCQAWSRACSSVSGAVAAVKRR